MQRIILIVDDTASCGETLAVALAGNPDLDVWTVASAQEALRVAATAPPALLITDLQMPRIDGFQLIECFRASPRLAGIPIIVISGDTNADTPDRLRKLGADAFFGKPFSPAAVRRAVESMLYAK